MCEAGGYAPISCHLFKKAYNQFGVHDQAGLSTHLATHCSVEKPMIHAGNGTLDGAMGPPVWDSIYFL
jgi:hypothetical protein